MLHNADASSRLIVTCSGGLESYLSEEIQQLTGKSAIVLTGAVETEATLKNVYDICLWSRIGSRVLLPLLEFPYQSEIQVYEQLRTISWHEHFTQKDTLAISVSKTAGVNINTQFLTYKAKDAIIDHFRDLFSERPNVSTRDPDIRIHLHFAKKEVFVALDLAGHPLHQRGYRVAQNEAPMKETLAAGLLMAAGWPGEVDQALIDPMCGSGTLLIEAAMMQSAMAPGLLRRDFGFTKWRFHNEILWDGCVEAAIKCDRSEQIIFNIKGYDSDPVSIQAALKNIKAAGLEGCLHVERRELAHFYLHQKQMEAGGVLVCNPPYGERLDQDMDLVYLYRSLADKIQRYCQQWRVAIITNTIEFADVLPLSEPETQRVFNGPIKCFLRSGAVTPREPLFTPVELRFHSDVEPPVIAVDLANRLQKNLKPLQKWAAKEGVSAYRLYDADIPEYNFALDWYNGHFHVQEYAPPKSVDEEKAANRLDAALGCLKQRFHVGERRLHLKSRQRQKGKNQYRKLSDQKHFYIIEEQGALLLVNLDDYLDSGLFLDHRPMRIKLQDLASGKRFLNLFCYTGAATVHAGLGQAKKTVSVDLSATYLNWARNNLYVNGLSEAAHELVRSDCLQWLRQTHQQFDLIFVDPPTFSNSKRMQGYFDVQKGHEELLDLAMKRLEPGGLLIFSNNFNRFQLEPALKDRYQVKDTTKASLPPDFSRGKPAHYCWEFRHRVVSD